jgi:hypothetical protein
MYVIEPIEPDFDVLHFIRAGKLIRWDELLQLWERVQNYEALETIVDIAVNEHMLIWAAEESFRASWQAYRQMNS